MGSLASRPSVPSTPQVVYVPQAAAPSTTQTTSTANTGTVSDTQTAAETEARNNNLLQRDRSRFGTIQTSFRGLLGVSNNSESRKTLLGE